MKTFKLAACAFLAVSSLSFAHAEEIPVTSVMLPYHGYDDNDHVIAVVSGELPHVCYTLGSTRVERQGRVIRIHQEAWLRKTGLCGTGDADPDLTSPFMVEVSLGRLEAGSYDIQFKKGDQETGDRKFSVAVAETVDIDNYNYAAVKDVSVPSVARQNQPVRVSLRGIIDESCEKLSEAPRVEKQNEVFVVLPIVTRDPDRKCAKEAAEFRRTLDLGALKAGQYLVHVRSRNGRAISRVLDVYPY